MNEDLPSWLEDLMNLLDLDGLERHNWARRWTDLMAPVPRTQITHLSHRQMWNLRQVVRPRSEELGELVRRGLLRERDVLTARAMEMGVAFVDIDRFNLDSEATDLLSRELVTHHCVIPVKKDGCVWLAMSDPRDMEAIDAVKEATGCRVVPVLAARSDIERAIDRYYPIGG